ncbi:MAG: M23 family metallopeptidase [bacterium]|nr:M23 family metallopeptidase [bacterium]
MSLAHSRYRLSLPVLALFLHLAAGCAPAVTARAAPAPVPEAPRWPLDLPARWLTSNFMEYRGGRFHAGIDLKTRETEGFPAYAVEDGWISRVRATPGGYGRAVYLRGASGRTYVYAHLGRFNDRLHALVGAEQERSGTWRAELELAAGQVPVSRGEVLGLTGQSGTVGPHLHFEVRDEAGLPIDPLAAGFAVRDTIPPVIHHVRALPATAQARLEGAADARLLPVAGRPWQDGLAPALHASGPIAFSARIVEATDPAGHRLEPWLIELRVDGELVCRRANEAFDFAANAQQRLEWLECGGLREQWLHRRPAVSVPGRQGGLWYLGADGTGLSPGRHTCELVAIDRAGNRASVGWDLEIAEGEAIARGAGAWEPAPVEVSVPCSGWNQMVLAPLFEVVPEECTAYLQLLTPEAGGPALAPMALAMSGPASMNADQREQSARQGLVPAGHVVTWSAADWPLDGAPQVALPAGTLLSEASSPGTSMYAWDGAAWSSAAPLLPAAGPDKEPGFALPGPGTYAALRDTLPPVIAAGARTTGPHPGFGGPVPGVTPPRWAVLAVSVNDAGAGVAAGSLRALWDGRPLVVEPDLLRDRMLVELPDSTGSGRHLLEIEVADEAGLTARAAIPVRCGVPPGR